MYKFRCTEPLYKNYKFNHLRETTQKPTNLTNMSLPRVKNILLGTVLIGATLTVSSGVSAHSGGTDSFGCHSGSQPYHCHSSKSTPYKTPSYNFYTPPTIKPYRTPSYNFYTPPTIKPYRTPSYNNSGPTAICRNGTFSYSMSRSGTCSWNGGVQRWLR